MKEELIEAVEKCRLGEFVLDQYGNMPTKTVRRLLVLLAQYFTELGDDCSDDLIEDIEKFYHEDFE